MANSGMGLAASHCPDLLSLIKLIPQLEIIKNRTQEGCLSIKVLDIIDVFMHLVSIFVGVPGAGTIALSKVLKVRVGLHYVLLFFGVFPFHRYFKCPRKVIYGLEILVFLRSGIVISATY